MRLKQRARRTSFRDVVQHIWRDGSHDNVTTATQSIGAWYEDDDTTGARGLTVKRNSISRNSIMYALASSVSISSVLINFSSVFGKAKPRQ